MSASAFKGTAWISSEPVLARGLYGILSMAAGCRGEELLDLIQKPTAKEAATVEKFKTEGGPAVREYCPHLTKDDCCR